LAQVGYFNRCITFNNFRLLITLFFYVLFPCIALEVLHVHCCFLISFCWCFVDGLKLELLASFVSFHISFFFLSPSMLRFWAFHFLSSTIYVMFFDDLIFLSTWVGFDYMSYDFLWPSFFGTSVVAIKM
jgi:hypothetical protein